MDAYVGPRERDFNYRYCRRTRSVPSDFEQVGRLVVRKKGKYTFQKGISRQPALSKPRLLAFFKSKAQFGSTTREKRGEEKKEER